MGLYFMDYEIPLLKALIKLGGKAKPSVVYPEVENIMGLNPEDFPEEFEEYKSGVLKWKNKTAWAREYLKRKHQLDGSERGVWKITETGQERVRYYEQTQKDPDDGLATLQGIETTISEENISPKEGFKQIENIQIHETGGILGVRGIVYEPINEQGVILLFAALCHEFDFMIEGISSPLKKPCFREHALGTARQADQDKPAPVKTCPGGILSVARNPVTRSNTRLPTGQNRRTTRPAISLGVPCRYR